MTSSVPSPSSPCAYTGPALAPVTTPAEASACYALNGIFWMRNALPPHELDALRTAAANSFYEVLRTLMVKQTLAVVAAMAANRAVVAEEEKEQDEQPQQGLGSTGVAPPVAAPPRPPRPPPPPPPPVRYAEIVERDGGRYDCRHGFTAPPLSDLLRTGGGMAEALVPMLRAVLGDDAEVVSTGQLIALPPEGWLDIDADGHGEHGDQRWHTDARNGNSTDATDALTLFIPLCDLTPENGPTQFVLRSHNDGSGIGLSESIEDDAKWSAAATTLFLPAGTKAREEGEREPYMSIYSVVQLPDVLCAVCLVPCALCRVPCAVCLVLCAVRCALCTVCCVLCVAYARIY